MGHMTDGHGKGRGVAARIAILCAALTLALPALSGLGSGPAAAQSIWDLFGGNSGPKKPPVPSEPVFRPEAQPQPQPQAQPVPAPIPPAAQNSWGTKNPICLQLEQRLVQEGQRGNQSRDRLPQIEAEIARVDRAYNVGAQKLDRGCYEYFLFAKTFRNSPQCKDLAREVEVSKRRLAELEAQRQEIAGSSGRSYQDDIISELARNNCGANYVDQARRRDNGMWQDEEAVSGNTWSPQGLNGVATYRTICVRLCDGYYFPVSFSTLPSHFAQDADACASKCAAPVELFYYRNPGGSVDQSVALGSQAPYTNLKTAFRYRKEYVSGCSCKAAEYVPVGGDKKADAGGVGVGGATGAGSSAARHVNAQPAENMLTTGSTSPAMPLPAASSAPPAALPAEPAAAAAPSIDQGWQTEAETHDPAQGVAPEAGSDGGFPAPIP